MGLLVARSGLDPGTGELEEGCKWSDWSGEVGIIRESKKICLVVSEWLKTMEMDHCPYTKSH